MDLRNYFGTPSSSSKAKPASTRSEAKDKAATDKEKRERTEMRIDSDDEIPVVKKRQRVQEKTASPEKAPPAKKRLRVIQVDDDSDDEFVEKAPKEKGGKKAGASQEKKPEPVPSKRPSATAKNTVVKEEKKVREEKSVLSLKNQKVASPKKTSGKSLEKKKERDEFSEDSFDDSPKKKSPAKKGKKVEDEDSFDDSDWNESPKKKKSRKRIDSSEDSFDDSPKKKSPAKKSNKRERDEFSEDSFGHSPKKPAPSKTRSDPPKETSKIPTPAKKVSASQPIFQVNEVKKEEKEVFVPWVDKYKPKSLQQLVGQHGDRSPMRKLMAWLSGWKTWHLGEGAKIKRSKPPPGVPTDGSPFKAILLSGPPGVGKTSCAHLACELAGYNVVEMNASDVRNKKNLDAHIAQLTGSHQLEEYFGKKTDDAIDDTVVHHVLIMDEVDGMSGNEDRGGLRELVDIINASKIPIICICNDRGARKMQTLTNHTYDVRFPKPRAENLISRVMTICSQEKVKLSKEEAMEIIELSGHDVRQTIYNLQMRAIGDTGAKSQQKDYAINTFEAARRLLGQSATLAERNQMFFVDYSIMPLFVQDNYPKMKGNERSQKGRCELACLRKAADLLAHGDTIERTIRSSGAWKMLPAQAMLSGALPTLAMDGQIHSMINFPAWLGKNSNAGKRQRQLRQIEYHAGLRISASPASLVTDYLPVMRAKLTRPLIERKNEGIDEVVEMMDAYCLVKDDVDAIAELAQWPDGKKDPYTMIPSTVKAALTRKLNKTARALPYQVEDVAKGRKKAANVGDDVEMDEFGNFVEKKNEDDALMEDDEEEEEEKVVVKREVKNAAPKAPAASARGRGGARGGRGGRGRGGAK